MTKMSFFRIVWLKWQIEIKFGSYFEPMVSQTLLVGLNEITAILLSILNYTLISKLLCLGTCTARLQLLLLTAKPCMCVWGGRRERVFMHTWYTAYESE